MSKWFIMSLNDEQVSGPFLKDELVEMYKKQLIAEDIKIWGRSLSTWLNFENWQNHVKSSNGSKNRSKAAEPVWYFAHKGDSFGPMTYNELIIDLKNNMSNIGQIHLWTVGMQNWAPVFDFFNVTNELGINQRQHPRADIKGTATVQINDDQKTHFITKLTSISQGGVGLKEAFGLKSGDLIHIDITADGIHHKIKATAQVRYVTNSGYAGIKFENISAENASSIVQYIKDQNSQFKLKETA